MKDNLNKKFDIKNLFNIFLTAALPLICVGGISYFPYMLRPVLIYLVGIFSLITFVFSDMKIRLNAVNISAFCLVAFMAIQTLYSLDKDSTLEFVIIYACAFTILFIDMPTDKIQTIINIIYVFCIVIAFSIIISVLIDNCMLNYFSFIVNPNHSETIASAIKKELASGAYSGFARERGEAAFIMNIGFAVSFSKYFADHKLDKKDWFFLLIMISALVLTGKRTMFLVLVICFVVFMLISRIKGKVFKFACIALLALFAAFFALMYVPEFANLINRFMDEENVESMGNRDSLWKYLNMMIADYWLFGRGFASYNQYAYDNGLRVYHEKWTYHGHNSYLQCLGELGIIGFTIFAVMIISALVLTYKMFKQNEENKNIQRVIIFSMYIQLMMIIYAITGNPAYTKQMIFVYSFAVGITLCIQRHTITSNGKFGRYKNLQNRRGILNGK